MRSSPKRVRIFSSFFTNFTSWLSVKNDLLRLIVCLWACILSAIQPPSVSFACDSQSSPISSTMALNLAGCVAFSTSKRFISGMRHSGWSSISRRVASRILRSVYTPPFGPSPLAWAPLVNNGERPPSAGTSTVQEGCAHSGGRLGSLRRCLWRRPMRCSRTSAGHRSVISKSASMSRDCSRVWVPTTTRPPSCLFAPSSLSISASKRRRSHGANRP